MLPLELAANYIAQSAEGLAHAHEKGLIHRVRVGPFTKQGEIDQAMATLREAGLSATVVREPVNKAQ